MEAQAVETILAHVEAEDWELVSSEVVDFEVSRMTDPDRLARVSLITRDISEVIRIDEAIEVRARDLESMGFMGVDSLHVACAEKAGVTVFLTTDDGLLRRAKRQGSDIHVRVANPLDWLLEVMEQ